MLQYQCLPVVVPYRRMGQTGVTRNIDAVSVGTEFGCTATTAGIRDILTQQL